jgi:hypothetical protein
VLSGAEGRNDVIVEELVGPLVCKRSLRIFGRSRQKKWQESPQSPQARVARPPPQLLPQCPPTLLMFNEARSIVRGLLRHKARPPGRALWYLNIRPAVRPEKRASGYHDAVALLHGAPMFATMPSRRRRSSHKTLEHSRTSTSGEGRRAPCGVSCGTMRTAHAQQRNRRGPGIVRGRVAVHHKREHRLDQVSTVETGPGAQPVGQWRNDSRTGNAIVSRPRLTLDRMASNGARKICARAVCLI